MVAANQLIVMARLSSASSQPHLPLSFPNRSNRQLAAEFLVECMGDESTLNRFRSLVCAQTLPVGCRVWLGALSNKGHGQFWLSELDGRDRSIITPRFAFAVAYSADALLTAATVQHHCDEASCQLPDHLMTGSVKSNTRNYWRRREVVGSPLRDRQGALCLPACVHH